MNWIQNNKVCFEAEVTLKKYYMWSNTCGVLHVTILKLKQFFSNIIINFKMATKYQKTLFSVLNKVPTNQGIWFKIHWDIFLDYEIIVNIYASKYPSRMLLINPLSEN